MSCGSPVVNVPLLGCCGGGAGSCLFLDVDLTFPLGSSFSQARDVLADMIAFISPLKLCIGEVVAGVTLEAGKWYHFGWSSLNAGGHAIFGSSPAAGLCFQQDGTSTIGSAVQFKVFGGGSIEVSASKTRFEIPSGVMAYTYARNGICTDATPNETDCAGFAGFGRSVLVPLPMFPMSTNPADPDWYQTGFNANPPYAYLPKLGLCNPLP